MRIVEDDATNTGYIYVVLVVNN